MSNAKPCRVDAPFTRAIGWAIVFALSLILGGGLVSAQAAPIAFVQVNSAVPQTPQTTVTVTYTKAQAAGDLNVVVIGWSNSTGQINSVVDSKGNAYMLAVGPTVQSGVATQAIYYASSIAAAAANANTVTVTFSTAVSFPDIRIAEYSGIAATSPVDVIAAAQGSGTAASSGSVTTKNANDLLFGADKVKQVTNSAGAGYTNRLITSPNGDIVEDRTVTAAGSYSTTATLSGGSWIMQFVAFSATPAGPSISTLNPTSGAGGTPITITGLNFGASQGSSKVTFGGTPATTYSSWTATSIGVTVPTGAATGNVVVTVGTLASNGVSFTVVTPPSISTLSQSSGLPGTPITITGSNFGATQGASTVTFNGVSAGTASSWTAGSIAVNVPAAATTGNVVVTVTGVASNGVGFTVAPSISTLSQTSGAVGTAITITGLNFGAAQGGSTVTFGGTPVTTYSTWGATSIGVTVPSGATSGNIVVTVGTLASNGVGFTVILPPSINTLSLSSGSVGTPITITGSNFGATQGTSTVTFNGVSSGSASTWGAGSITVNVPPGASTGNVVVTVSGIASNGVSFMVTGSPITLVQRTGLDAGTATSSTLAFPSNTTAGNWIGVVIRGGTSGETFTVTDSGGNTYQKAVQFNETLDGDTLGIFYAQNIKGAANTITVKDTISATLRYAILEYSGVATTNSLDMTGAAQGTSTLPNSGNTTTTSGGELLLGAVLTANPATFTAANGYTIEQAVPAEPNSKLIVEDELQGSPGTFSAGASLAASDNWAAGLATFKAASGGGGVTSPAISGLNPTTGLIGATVTISGTNFGASQGTSSVTFGGTPATTFTSWGSSSIVVAVPSGAISGNVVVTVGGYASNGVGFTVILPPNISNLNPPSQAIGTSITINGTNFGSSQGGSTITFNGTPAGTASSWSSTAITAIVPAGATSGNVVVTVGGLASNASPFTVTSGPLYALSTTISSDRNYATGLQGATVLGYVYIFTSYAAQLSNFNPAGIAQVSYWVDNTSMTGTAFHVESATPYDFNGDVETLGVDVSNGWNTNTIADGVHTITQLVNKTDGTSEVDTATFTIDNGLTTTFTTGHYEYVATDQNLWVYSLDNPFQLVKHVSLPLAEGVRGIDMSPVTHMLYISYGGAGGSTGNGSLIKYDLVKDAIVWTQNYNFGVDAFAITPDGSTIYLPDGADSTDGAWNVINASTGAVTGSIHTGMDGAHNTVISLDGAYVFMGPIQSSYLVKGIPSTNSVALNIGPLNQGVRPFTINGKHTLAFTTADTASGIEFQVSDTSTGNVLYTVPVPGFTVPPTFTADTPVHGISLSPDETELYLIDVANSYVHVFGVTGLPSSAPVLLANIPLTTNFTGFESPCFQTELCPREGWLLHTLDGQYVMVGDSGNVINTKTRQVIGTIPELINTRHGNIEIDWQNGVPVSTSTHFGLGYVTQ